jgi:deoxyribonuclease-4
MWRARTPEADEIRRIRAARDRFDLAPLSIHASYLINLASPDPVIRPKSIEGFRGELERAAAIGAEYLVVHPGSCGCCTKEEGIASVAMALRDASAGLGGRLPAVLLENTAGAGTHLGSRFEELQSIRELTRDLTRLEVGYCLDTCHLLAAGFDVSSAAGLRTTLREVDETLGWANVHILHANDSKGPLGSHIDRHANIGEGHIGLDGFRRMLHSPSLRSKPFLLETPVEREGDDRRNLDTLNRLAARRRTSARRV